MGQITITREEFREKIIKNPESYGIVRAMCKDPEKMTALREIETDLFGPEE